MKIFVANFDEFAHEDDLRSLFSRYGLVRSAHIFRDRKSNDSLGFAVLGMSNDRHAERAIRDLDGRCWRNGQRLKVSKWRRLKSS